MATKKQIEAARENIKKAQKKWQEMSHRERALAQPQGKDRAKVGEPGEGEYFRIIVRPKDQFVFFRYHDVGEKGHIMRLAGKRQSGSWATHAWLISKSDAHIEGTKLIPDTEDAKNLLKSLSSEPEYVEGDIFKAKDRRNVPEREKPTEAQKKAQAENIKKAQQARKKRNKS